MCVYSLLDYRLLEGTVQFMFYSLVQFLEIGELNRILLRTFSIEFHTFSEILHF